MATEADIAKPVCETRGEQGENLVYQPTNISIGKLHQEEKIQADTYNERSTVEGENFLKTPSIGGEVHYEVNKNSPNVSKVTEELSHVKDETEILPLVKPNFDDQPVEIAANEEKPSEGIQQEVEKSNGLEKDDDRGMVTEECSTDSQIKAGDTLDHPDLDHARVETQQSEEITNDHHGTNDSFTEKIALPREMLRETNLPSKETKKSEATTLQSEELNVDVEMTDEKAGDGKKTEEDISCNLTTDVSRGECENKKTSEQDGLVKERNIEDDLDTGADKGSREDNMYTETISNETSNDEFQSKNNLNSSFHKEEDMAIQKDDKPMTTSEDSRVILENTLNESSGDVESQSKILEDNTTDPSDPDLPNTSEESSCIQVDGSQIEHDEQSEEESKNLILTQVSTGGTINSESKVKDEDEDLKKAELFENEQSTSILLKGDEQIENPAESLHVSPENIEASNLGQEIKKRNCPEDQSTDKNLYENTGGDTEEKSIDAVDTQKEIIESISTIASSSSEEGSTNAVLPEVPSNYINERIIDADNTQKKVLENFSTISNVDVERNSMSKLDGAETKNEEQHLGNESEKPSLPLPLAREATDKNESILLHEAQIEDGEERKAEFCENERITESMVLKIEPKIEKSEDALNVISKKTKAPDVDQEIEISSIDEQNVSIHPQGILDDKTENTTVNAAETEEEAIEIHDVPTIVPNEKTEENSLIQDDGPEKENEKQLDKDTEKPSLIEDFTGNNVKDEVKIDDERTDDKTIDVANTSKETPELQNVSNKDNEDSLTQVDASNIEHNTYLKEEIDRGSLTKAPAENANDNESSILIEPKIGNECPKEVELFDSETNINSTLLKKKDTQDAPEDQIASISSEEIETTCSFEEESLVMRDNIIDVTDSKEITHEVQNVATKIPYEHMEENSFAQVNCSQIEPEKHLKDSENSSSPDTPTEEIYADEPKDIHEPKNSSKDSIKVALENEIYTESTPVKEEAQVEKPIDSLQLAVEDIKASDSTQDSNSIKEQISTADPQEISSDETKKEYIDAADRNEESLEPQDIATDTPDGDNADNSPIEEEEATTWKNNDEPTIMHETDLVGENEKSAESTLVKEEVHIESSRLAAHDIGESALGQDRETSTPDEQILTTNPLGIVDDSKENKTSDATSAEQGAPEDKDIPKSTLYEEIEEKLHIQLDCSQLEQNEDLENGSENTSLRESPTEEMESTLVKEKAQEEKPIDSLQEAAEEIKTPIACQETSSTEEETLVSNQQEISCNNTKERAIDAYTEKENLEDVATIVPNGNDEENSPIEVDGSHEPSTEEATIGNNNDEESIVTQEAELVDEKENYTECTLAKDEVYIESLQVAAHDIKASALGQERETNTPVEQSPTTTPQGVVDYTKEDKTNDATGVEEQIPEDKQDSEKTTRYEDIEENLPVQVDCSQLEQNEDLKKDIDNKPLIEAPVGEVIERTLVNEEAQVEKPIDSLQATSASCQETSSIEEKILTVNLPEISCDTIEEKTIDAAYTKENLEDVATNVPNGNSEANSPLEVDGVKKPSLDEASTANTNDDVSTTIHDAKYADENIVNAVLLENEKNIECAFVNEEVSVKSLQVENEDNNATASSRDEEANCLEEQDLITNSEGIMSDHKEDKTTDATDLKEETLEDKSNATYSHEDILQNSLVPVDCSQLVQNEHSERENESASLQEALTADTTKSTLVYEKPVEDHIEPLQVATEDIKAFAPCQDTETSSTMEQFITANPDDVSRDKTIEKIDVIDKELTLEVQDATRNVPHGDNSPIEEDGSQKPSLKEASTEDAKDYESTIAQEAEFVDESLKKYDFLDHEKNTEDTLVKEDISIESSQEAVENINTSNLSEDIETISQEEQVQSATLGGLIEEDKDSITIGSTDQQEETPKDEVSKEIETADNEAKQFVLKEEASYLKDLQMNTTVNIAAHEEKDSNSAAEMLPRTDDLNVNDDVVGHTSEDSNWKQEESSITNASEEHTMPSNENVLGVTGLESETSERNKDHKVVEEANTCGDKTDTEKIGVLNDGSITIPTNETLAETDPRGSTEADFQVSNGEEDAELAQQDRKTETVQKDIEEQLFINASQVVSESKGVNDDEETTDSDNCKEKSGSSKSLALKEVASCNVAIEENSTSNSFKEGNRETREQAENEEAQKQEEKLHVSALIQDSSTEKVEEDVQLCVASANDSDITQGMQKLEEVPLLAPEEKIVETKECKETEVEEGATRNKERDDTIEIFLDDKKATEREQEETKSTQEEVTLDEEVDATKSTAVPVPNDFLQVPLGHIPDVDHSITGREATTDKDELHTGEKAIEDNEETKIQKVRDDDGPTEQKTSEVSPAASIVIEAKNQEVATLMSDAPEEDITEKYMIEANDSYKEIDTTEGSVINESTSLKDILVNNESTKDLESKIDEEASDILELIQTATEGQDVVSTSVRETSTYIGGTTEEKSDSNAPEEPKSGYEPKNPVLESVAQVQAFDIISETEETKIEEESLKTAAEIKSEKIVAHEILEQKETTYETEIIKDNISSKKIKEEGEDVKDCHQDSHEEEVITESHLAEEAKQGEEIIIEEIFEVTKNENEIEKLSKIYKVADDKAPEEPEENILANESIDRSLHQKEQAKSVEEDATILHTEEGHGLDIAYVKTGTYDSNKEINSSTVVFPEEESNRTGAGDADNEMAEYEGLLNQNSKIPAIDEAAELPKGLNEYIICEAPPTATVHKTTEDFEAKKENTNTIMMLQQEEDSTTKHEILPELARGKESEKQSQKDETCSSNETQAEDEEKLKPSALKSEEENQADTWREPNEGDKEICIEADTLDCSSDTKNISEVSISNGAQDIAEDNENSNTKTKSSEEEYPYKSIGSQISTVSDEIELKEPKAGIDSQATIPNATGVVSRQVEEDKCEVMDETSTPVDSHIIPKSNIIEECTVGSSLEVKDQQTKPHDLPQELNIRDTEVDLAEKDDPENLQNVRDIREDLQELNEGSFEASNNENPVEAVPDGNIQTSGRQDTEGIQIALVPEILKQETEDHELGRTSESVSKAGVNCEEEKTINETENVSESKIHQSCLDETAQHDKNEVSHPDFETAEKDPPLDFADTEVTDLEVTPLPSKDKHIVLEADHSKSPYPENPNGKENISAECAQGEHEIQKPSIVEQEEPDCGNEERTDQETREKLELEETNKPSSLSDLFDVSMRHSSQMENHSVIEKEPTTHREDLKAERTDEAEHEDAKLDEEKCDEEESSEQKRSELSFEAPVMVEIGDADVKVSHKKSHNILSGVGSKVKHSIAKVKKAITGKSSHPKTPSPKKDIS